MSHLQSRLIFGTISTLLSLFLLWLSSFSEGRLFFTLSIAAIVSIASFEFISLANSKGYYPLAKATSCFAYIYIVATYLETLSPSLSIMPYLIVFVALVSAFIYYFKAAEEPLIPLALAFFSFTYLCIPLSSWIYISSFQKGSLWLLYLLLVTKFTDIGAYFIGSTFGKNKLAPYISPGKSLEGALGGLVTAILVSFLFYLVGPSFSFPISLSASLLLGLSFGIMGQVGDLAESLLKRDAKIKNSSTIPGLGGILDMVDSLVFTSPILYIFLKVTTS